AELWRRFLRHDGSDRERESHERQRREASRAYMSRPCERASRYRAQVGSRDEPTTRGRGGVLARARARRYAAIGGVAERLVALARTPPRPRAQITCREPTN